MGKTAVPPPSDAPGPDVPRDEGTLESLVARCLERSERMDERILDEVCTGHPDLRVQVADRLRTLIGMGMWGAGEDPPAPAGAAVGSEPSGEIPHTLERLARRGDCWGRFEIQQEIARGGQGRVVRVWDEDLRRTLAMKRMLDGAEARPREDSPQKTNALGRFLEEAQVTAQLDHPGIVPVHELGLDPGGGVYFTMKLVQGLSLKEVIDLLRRGEGGWSLTRVLSVLQRVCDAMAYAHSKGVIHRDLKPSNLMVGHFGEVYVMDWGLARAAGRPELHDMRLETERESPQAEGEREAQPLRTRDGTVLGTPAFMSPEQANGQRELLSPRTDVYALGAILYNVLTGHPPYMPPGTRASSHSVLARLIGGPPAPIPARAGPAELVAIQEKAMQRDPERRYPDMSALARDLTAFLEQRVVTAYQTGALPELSKWMQRNKPLATALATVLVVLITGLAVALSLEAKSEHNFVLARENEALAANKSDELTRLSSFQRLDDLERSAEELWPPSPELVEDYRTWLVRARDLVAELEPSPDGTYLGHRAKLAELRTRIRALTPEEREGELRVHPRFDRLAEKRARLARLVRARDLRASPGEPEAETLVSLESGLDARVLGELAWPLVDPDRHDFGQEARGLALARRALDVADQDTFARTSEILAWAFFANGADADALAEFDTVLSLIPHERQADLAASRTRLRAEIASLQHALSTLADLDREIVSMENEMCAASRFDHEEDRWWNNQLHKLVQAIEAFADPDTGLIEGSSPEHGWGIARRLAFAATIREHSVSGDEARERWRAAILSISNPAECPLYEGRTIVPQLGLLPIGRDAHSGLWEFAHLLSGEPPIRDQQGRLVLEEKTGIVLVLLPGGTFWMGSQSTDPAGHNYDPRARPDESPPRQVRLSPFFLSKFELTQGQWLRVTSRNPSRDDPLNYEPIWQASGRVGDLLHPVEQVTWHDCVAILPRLDLVLPSEAQWEYGARGGTSTPWWTGSDERSVAGAANLNDRYARDKGMPWPDHEEWLDDGHLSHARVGSFAPNPFGLHDVIGNVWEWCRDAYSSRWLGTGLDPVNEVPQPKKVVARGGSLNYDAGLGRSACRMDPEATLIEYIGLRAARRYVDEPAVVASAERGD